MSYECDNPVTKPAQQKRMDEQDYEGTGTGPRLPTPREEERKQERES